MHTIGFSRKLVIPLFCRRTGAVVAVAATALLIWPTDSVGAEVFPLGAAQGQSVQTEATFASPATSASPVQSAPTGNPVSLVGFCDFAAAESASACDSMTCESDEKKKADKEKQKKLNDAMLGAYQGVFYANKFDYLQDPAYHGPYFLGDSLKGMANNRLDVGGEFRLRYHSEHNMRGAGLTGLSDDFLLHRSRVFANLRVHKRFRIYGEYLYADSGGQNHTPRVIEVNRGEAQNLFADGLLYDGEGLKVSARAGRQELLFGSQRVVSPLDWANTRRTFDGYRMMFESKKRTLDLFYTNPVLRVARTGDTNHWDSSNNDQKFYGAYLSEKLSKNHTFDSYYLGYNNQTANFDYHTLGSRMVGSFDTLLYEAEGGVQFGNNFNGSGHGAGFITCGLGRKMSVPIMGKTWKPTVWGWYDWASGGTGNQAKLGDDSFHHLFPLAHKYNGFMDLFGRRNLNDVNCQIITPVSKKVSLLVWYHYFFLDRATTPYSVVMQPYNTTATAVSKDLGHEIDLLMTINMNPRDSLLLGYSTFFAGDYYDTPGVLANSNANFFYCQYQKRF